MNVHVVFRILIIIIKSKRKVFHILIIIIKSEENDCSTLEKKCFRDFPKLSIFKIYSHIETRDSNDLILNKMYFAPLYITYRYYFTTQSLFVSNKYF